MTTLLSRLAVPVAVTAALAVAIPVPASADEGRGAMYAALGVDDVGADYLFLIDASTSMRPSFSNLKKELTTFSGSLASGDRLAFVPFGAQPDPQPWLPAKSSESSAAIAGLDTPDQKDTDFLTALNWAVDHLARDTSAAGRVATVVLLTDGDPSAPGLAECALPPASTWAPVRSRVRELEGTRPVHAYAVPLELKAKQCHGPTPLSVLQQAFPSGEQINPGASTTVYLDQAKESARAEKARQLLSSKGELDKTVTITWPDGVHSLDPTQAGVRLPVRLAVSGSGPAKVADLTGTLSVKVTDDDGTRAVEVPVTADPATVTIPAGGQAATVVLTANLPQPGGRTILREDVTLAGTVSLNGRISAPWLDLAGGDLASKLTSTITPAQAEVAGTGSRGVPNAYWLVLLVLAVVAAVWPLVRYHRARPLMSGDLDIKLRDGQTTTVTLHNRRTVRKAVGDGTLHLRGVREDGTAKMAVTWTPAIGSAAVKTLSAGKRVILGSVDVRHRPRGA
ncbi:vWA domain-containing protein [Actinoplanes regularis]|uniref:von Willebrand factor type A domain-containing protein n=1 Tax=Actinoplanes regularis TaxID=52697 RepID=A0A238UX59_9ACTN|nr:vWA domain-containing protein [Actinoplanes regularis]GIE84389.1 hypothetical protein Are01nite_08690 [Actinoplanes regularis]SNR25819.1 von Willebrand factor type A domain-containing protein [Actinoplanes regularis]